MLLAIDPGADSGWALFGSSRLLEKCGLGRPTEFAIAEVVIEKPRIYPGAKQKARAEDVITLAVRAGEWGGRYEHLKVRYVEPHGWKGAVPKEIHQPRIWAKLDAREKDIVDRACKGMAPSKRHNVIDAVGIGLWAVGRAA